MEPGIIVLICISVALHIGTIIHMSSDSDVHGGIKQEVDLQELREVARIEGQDEVKKWLDGYDYNNIKERIRQEVNVSIYDSRIKFMEDIINDGKFLDKAAQALADKQVR